MSIWFTVLKETQAYTAYTALVYMIEITVIDNLTQTGKKIWYALWVEDLIKP